MHDLGEFMKGLLQHYTQWHNRAHSRSGRLWEDRFKSLIVEDGVAAKTISAYIDLNPVRAGMVKAKSKSLAFMSNNLLKLLLFWLIYANYCSK